MQVSDLKVGQTARITALSAPPGPYRQKLIAMGLIPGTALTVSRIAPLGDPIEVTVRGCVLSLRKHEANVLNIEVIS